MYVARRSAQLLEGVIRHEIRLGELDDRFDASQNMSYDGHIIWKIPDFPQCLIEVAFDCRTTLFNISLMNHFM